MAIRKKKAPVNPLTGKPFAATNDLEKLQAEEVAATHAAAAAAQARREEASQHPTAGTLPKVPTGAEMGQSNPAGPAGGKAETVGQMMPAQKPILPHPAWRPPTPGKAPAAPRTIPASIVPHASPSAGAPKVAGVVASTNASGTEPAAGGTASTALPTPALTPQTAPAVLTQTQKNNAEAEVATVLGYNVDPNLAKNALSWVEGMQASGADDTTIQNEMYNQNWFKQAFPGITAALANGISPPDPITYSKDYSSVQSMLSGFGIPTGAISPQLYGELVGRGLSSADIKNNIGTVFSAAPAVSQAAQADLSKWYGVPNTPGAIAALLIDPQGALARENGGNGLMPPSAPLAQTVGTAAVGGALAGQSGFSKLSKQDLITMAGSATATQIGNAASADIGTLGATETGTKNAPTVTEAQLLESGGASNAGIQSNKGAQQAVERAVGARTAQFGGGGGNAGAGQPGESGAGFGTQ